MSEEDKNLFGGVKLPGQKDPDLEDSGLDIEELAAVEVGTSLEKGEKEEKEDEKDTNTDADTTAGIDVELLAVADTSDDNNEDENQEELEDNTSGNDDPSANNSSSPLLTQVTKTLQAEGLITLEEGKEITNAKELVEAYRETLKENEFKDLTEEQKLYVEALRAGIPEEEVKNNFNNRRILDQVKPESIEADENLRTVLIAQKFLAKGLSEDEAAKMAKRSVELGEDIEDAKEAYTYLKETEETRLKKELEEQAAKKANQEKIDKERLEKLKDEILKTEEFVPEIKVNSTTKEKIFDNMTKVVGYDDKGNAINAITKARMDNPDHFAKMDSFFYTITKGYTDFSKFKNTVKSSAIEDLDKKLKGNQTGGGTPGKITSSSGNAMADFLKNYNA